MESDKEALVKDERQAEAIPVALPPPIFLRQLPADPLFRCFQSPPPYVMAVKYVISPHV
jgi:hypothetical protein